MDTGDFLAEDAEGAEEGIGLFGFCIYCFDFIRIRFLAKSAKGTLYNELLTRRKWDHLLAFPLRPPRLCENNPCLYPESDSDEAVALEQEFE